MNYKQIILIIFLNFNIIKPIDSIDTAIDWSVSAGLTWLEAYKYLSLTQDEQTLELIGSEDIEESEAIYIREILNKHIKHDWQKYPIKLIQEDLRIYIPYALICTDNIIFVNLDIYDLVTIEEKVSAILRAGIMIKQKHIFNSAMFLILLPFITHFGLQYYDQIINSDKNPLYNNFSSDSFAATLSEIHNGFIKSSIFKLAINTISSMLYFKYKSRSYDKKIIKMTSNYKNLLNYYAKIKKVTNVPNLLIYLRHANLNTDKWFKNIAVSQ